MMLRRMLKLSPLMLNRMRSTFEQPDLNNIRQEFRRFDGGRVTVSRMEADGLAFICIDHPEKKNGFSGKMMVDLSEAVTSLESWEAGKGVIVYGRGDMICSGGYLTTVREICNSRDGYKMCSLMQDTLIRLRRLPLVSVSVVHGKALGGGAELILATDFRLMTSSAEIQYVEARMGVGTGWGGGYFLSQLVGRSTALDLLLTCRKVGSEEALKLGLINDILPPHLDPAEGPRLEYAVKWIKERTQAHHPSTVQTVKRIVDAEDLEAEREAFAESWGGPEQKQALNKHLKHK